MLGLIPFRHLPRSVQALLLANLFFFLPGVLFALFRVGAGLGLLDALVLVPGRPLDLWRYVTYAFVHVNPMHFLFNMLMLWMFGEEVARWMGERKFLALYFFSGVFAGLVSVPFYLWVHTAILGASGALFGVLVAYAFLFPDRKLLIFFVFPMHVRWAVLLLIGIDLMMARSSDGIAHFTHLGGVLAGALFMVVYLGKIPLPWARISWNLRKKRYLGGNRSLEGEIGYLDEQKQLDSVLAKISRSGMGSLTPDEIQFLQNASIRNRTRRGF